MVLQDNEVAQEMNKMVSFIKQEAMEKAREIHVKADEEFNIEKAKLVRSETVAIEAFFEKKLKQAEITRKIAQSTQINKNRLRVLSARQQVLNELFSESRSKLLSVSANKTAYATLVKNLILQTLFQLMEPQVSIQCRKQDVDIVDKGMAEAKIAYKEALGTDVSLHLEPEFLPAESAGGIVASAKNGNIKVSNTLESRLLLLSESMLPEIRIMLFGPSASRKFFN